jgi:hypothetical protein
MELKNQEKINLYEKDIFQGKKIKIKLISIIDKLFFLNEIHSFLHTLLKLKNQQRKIISNKNLNYIENKIQSIFIRFCLKF